MWGKAIIATRKLSISAKHQERNYKILARWYRCPVDLHKMNPDNTDICWRCHWYYCSEIQPFWQKIFEIFRALTGTKLYPEIQVAVLSMIPGSIKKIKGILKYFLTAARKVIARKWKNTRAPSVTEWECEMTEMRTLEERMIIEEGLKKQRLNIWTRWEEFRASSRFLRTI